MPSPIAATLGEQQELAVSKAKQLRSSPARYFVSAMLAGAFVGVAIVLMVMVSGSLIATQSPYTKLVQGSVFGIALTLVVFAGAELFTGNNMVMLQGVLAKRTSWLETLGVWVASLIGNLCGALAFAWLVNAAGVVTTGAAPGKVTPVKAALKSIAASKDALTGGQLFFRAVLCNFLVCLALWMAARATSDAAKILCLWWALLAFVASGFEHSIANMTALSLAAMIGVAKWSVLWRNLLFTVPGNLVGGGLLVGVAYGWLGATPAPDSAGLFARLNASIPRVRFETGSSVAANGPSAATALPGPSPEDTAVTPEVDLAPAPVLSARAGRRSATARATTPPPRRRASTPPPSRAARSRATGTS